MNYINGKLYESYWKTNELSKDDNNVTLPEPKSIKWNNKELFLQKLKDVQDFLRRLNKFNKIPHINCILCKTKNVTKGFYEINNIRWRDELIHYIEKHNVKPSDKFVDTIFKFQTVPDTESKEIARFKSMVVKKNKLRYIKLNTNQLLIMDALMLHGSYSKKYKDSNSIYRYSEHAGLLDFSNNGLDKIIISGKTERVDAHDMDIFLPKNMLEAYDYEYMFHTHPATPKAGGRVNVGILYEFPSIGDIFHFLEHFNNGVTQGSLVIAPEGMYNIRKKTKGTQIKFDEDELFNTLSNELYLIQKNAIKKYGSNFNDEKFYSVISQDSTYIDMFNKILNNFDLHIDFFSRVKDKVGNWIIEDIYLPVYPMEVN